MSLSGNSGRPVKLKVPAEYKLHKVSFAVNKPFDKVIDLSASVLFSFATGLLRNARLVTSIVNMSVKEKFSMGLGKIEATSSLFISRRLSITCERVNTLVMLSSSIASKCDVRQIASPGSPLRAKGHFQCLIA